MRGEQRLFLIPVAALPVVAVLAPPLVLLSRIGQLADPLTLLTAVVGSVAWALVGWLTLVAVTNVSAGLPGRTGRGCERVARWVTPALVARACRLGAGAGAGAGLVLGATPALAAPAVGVSGAGVSGAGVSGAGVSGARVSGADGALRGAPCPAGRLPDLDRAGPLCGPVSLPAGSAAPKISPAQPTAPPLAAPTMHRVQRGESLWLIARAELGPGATDARVAARWPAWWQANRAQVGEQPSLLYPGELLQAPD